MAKQEQSIELSRLERFDGDYGFRINGKQWEPCKSFAGFTPASDAIEHLQAAVVAVAYSHGLAITEDQVAVDGRCNAYWYPANEQ